MYRNSFIKGMDTAIEHKRFIAQLALNMYGHKILRECKVIFEGVSPTGYQIKIPITEDMLNVSN